MHKRRMKMKTLIVYSSQTGNTRKLADKIYDTLDGVTDIISVEQDPDPAGYDLVAVGFWYMGGKPDPKSQKFLSKIGSGTKVFLFATHGAGRDSEHAKNGILAAVNLVKEAEVVGAFSCQGEVNPDILEKVSQRPQPPEWLPEAPLAIGHPNESDFVELVQMLKKI